MESETPKQVHPESKARPDAKSPMVDDDDDLFSDDEDDDLFVDMADNDVDVDGGGGPLGTRPSTALTSPPNVVADGDVIVAAADAFAKVKDDSGRSPYQTKLKNSYSV